MRSVGGMTKEAWGPLFFDCMYTREKKNMRAFAGSLREACMVMWCLTRGRDYVEVFLVGLHT